MVPQAALNAWAQVAPWPTELDIEQDLVLSTACGGGGREYDTDSGIAGRSAASGNDRNRRDHRSP